MTAARLAGTLLRAAGGASPAHRGEGTMSRASSTAVGRRLPALGAGALLALSAFAIGGTAPALAAVAPATGTTANRFDPASRAASAKPAAPAATAQAPASTRTAGAHQPGPDAQAAARPMTVALDP